MSLEIDRRYAAQISPYVRNFTRKPGNTFQFSCPYCGDSSTIRSKARGYLYRDRQRDRLRYGCFNCSTPLHSLYDLLKFLDNNLAEQYRVESFLEQKTIKKAEPAVKQASFIDNVDQSLIKVSSLPDYHPAKQYVMNRLIPSDKHYLIYYTRTFKQFARTIDPSMYQKFDEFSMQDEARLIIPLVTRDQKISGYQGRALQAESALRYITVLPHPDNSRMFGLDRHSRNHLTPVLEGPIDALFLPNAVASCGGQIDTCLPEAGISADKAVIVYDNEPRSIYTVRKMKKAIAHGYRVCFWPDDIHFSDVNDMILGGLTAEQILTIIKQNSDAGLMAELKLSNWRKV